MSSSSSNADYLRDTVNCLNFFGHIKTKKQNKNADSTALVSLKAQAGPAATSFPYTRLPPELRIMIIEAIDPFEFSQDIGRLTISKEWYPYACLRLLRNISLSRISDPFAFLWYHPQGPNDEWFRDIRGALACNLTHLTMDLDRMLRRYQFLPTDADTHSPPDLEGRRAIDSLDPERESLKLWQRQPRKDPTSLEEAAAITIDLLKGSAVYLNKVSSWDISLREPWSVHRTQVSYLDWGFNNALSILAGLRVVKLNQVKLDIPGLARRDTPWSSDRQNQAHRGLPFFLLDADHMEGTLEDPQAAPAWNNPREVVLYDDRHLCSGIRKVLPHLEVLHIRTRSMCPEMFRPNGHALHDAYIKLWPYLAEDASWLHLVPDRLSASAPMPLDSPLPKLKEVVINMIMPWMRYKNPRVVSCWTHDCLLTHEAELKFSDQAYTSMLTEAVDLTHRMTDPRQVVVRFAEVSASDMNMKYWEYDALTDTQRRISVDQWGDFVAYIGPVEHDALERHVPVWEAESHLNGYFSTGVHVHDDMYDYMHDN